MRFAIVVHKDEGSSYGVTVPDLPGCFSGGETLDDAFLAAQEAIAGHIETLLMDGQMLPQTRPLAEHQANDDFQSGLCWGFVDVDLADIPNKVVRVNITVPSRMLALFDDWAKREGESRSGFLTKAALAYIGAKENP